MSVALDTAKSAQKISSGKLRKDVWRLAFPAVVEQSLVMSVGIADAAMVGRLGPDSIASVDISNRFLMFAFAIFAAIQVGTTAIVARHIGANEPKQANEAAKQSLLMVGAMAIVLTLVGYVYAPKLIQFVMILNENPDPLVVQKATSYLRIVLYTCPLALIMMTVNAVLRGAGDTKTPMVVTGLNNVVNVIGNILFIFGVGPFPEMGVAGAAVGTAIAQGTGGILVLFVLYSGRSALRLSLTESYRLQMVMIRRILKVGIPAAVEQFFMRGGQLLFSMIIAGMSTVAMAAHAITLNAESLSFMPGFGFSIAATTLIGQHLGAGSPETAEQSGREAGKMAAMVMSIMGVMFFLFPSPMIKVFTTDPEVIRLGSTCLRIVAISQPFLAWLMVLSGALRGAGDTKWVMVSTTASLWPVRLGLGYFLGITMGMGLVGAWIAMVVDLMVRGSLMMYRFRTGKWKTISV